MKKLIQQISIVMLGCFAVSANAKPISQSYKTVAITDNSVQLMRLETIGVNSSAPAMDSTQLKIMGISQDQIFTDVANDAGLVNLALGGARPVLITQAMMQPANTAAIDPGVSMDIGSQGSAAPVPAASPAASPGASPSTAPDNNVIVVPEPPMLLLLGLGLVLAGARRKG